MLRPDGSRRTWTLYYDADANDGAGEIVVTLDDETVKFSLAPEARKGNATFDRFGVVSWHRGGYFVEMYFDDLVYTVQAPAQ